MNEELVENFKILQTYHRSRGENNKVTTYGRIITALKGLNFRVTNVSQIQDIRGIGKESVKKIQQFLDTGKIEAVENVKEHMKQSVTTSKRANTIKEFQTVWGVGPKDAEKFYDKGLRSIKELKTENLTRTQQIGVKYYDEINSKIPRKIIDVVHTLLMTYMNEMYGKENYSMEIAGSYRRGAKKSNDIDVLVTSKVFTLKELVDGLHKIGLITDIESIKTEKFMGIFKCPSGGNHMRIDIMFVPEKSWAPALLYFTGSKNTNIWLRSEAKKRGMMLNQHGLYKDGKEFTVATERDIFNYIGVEYIPPQNR